MGTLNRSTLIGPTLVLATLVSSIISSFGAPLIPTIADDFHVPVSTAQWSLTVALLVGAISSPVLGRLGDSPRRRATLLSGLVVVTVGSILAAIAGSLGMLLVGRALQGVGLGLSPLAMAIAQDTLPRSKVSPMIGLLSVSAGAGLGAGYPISGWLAEAWNLPGAYWFGAAVAALTTVCVAAVIPPTRTRNTLQRLDWPGVLLLSLALTATLVAVSEGAHWGWGSPATIVLLISGVVLLTGWTVQQLRAIHPLVQLRLLGNPSVLSGNACALALGAAMYMVLSGVTEFAQSPSSGGFGFSASAAVAGLTLIPLSFFMLISSSRILPVALSRLGRRTVLTLGCFIAAIGCGFFALAHDDLWQAFAMTAILGIGLGVTFAAIPGAIVQAVPSGETGSATGFYQVVRFTGFAIGSALTATILTARATAGNHATLEGYTTVLWVSAALCVSAGALVWLLQPARSVP
jgi:MFS family permease